MTAQQNLLVVAGEEGVLADALDLAPLTTQVTLGEMSALTATGNSVPVEVSLSFDRLPDGEIITVFARDLTSHKRAEAQRRLAKAMMG